VRKFFVLILGILVAGTVLISVKAEEPASQGGDSLVKVRVISPRSGAELPADAVYATIVVEVEDPAGKVRLKEGIPVFASPRDSEGEVDRGAQENLDIFLSHLVEGKVTTFTMRKPGGRNPALVYQLTSRVPVTELVKNCRRPIYPEVTPAPGETIYPIGYKAGAQFLFQAGNSRTKWEKGDSFSPSLCLVFPGGADLPQ
jgi:hypothetical protein